jgi:hypothetical protein
MFDGCAILETIDLPSSVNRIEDEAFKDCASLKRIVLPKTLKKIGGDAFKDCKLFESIVVPKSVKEIGKDAFSGCPKLTIRAPKGSYAEQYANENGIKYEPLE